MTTERARIELPDRRSVGYADYGAPGQTAVLWCHGGPGSRLEPQALAPLAREAGLRIVGIDRPGYGDSSPRPGRTIADWVPDALAVADRLGIGRFVTVGVSTGGAYALALAARSERVLASVACCALTDMRWEAGKAMMTREGGQVADIWGARDRDTALAVALESFGHDGGKMLAVAGSGPALPPADLALLTNPEWVSGFVAGLPVLFAHGVQGYVDDRLADGPGWGSFDVAAIRCPVLVLHGGRDTIVPVAHAHHTAELVPGARLRVSGELGHFSIIQEVLGAVRELAPR